METRRGADPLSDGSRPEDSALDADAAAFFRARIEDARREDAGDETGGDRVHDDTAGNQDQPVRELGSPLPPPVDEVSEAEAQLLAERLLAGCLRRPVLFDAIRSLPRAKLLLPDEGLQRAFEVMDAMAQEVPLTPRGFLLRARQAANENADDALDRAVDAITRAPSGTRADLDHLVGRAQRKRLAALGDRLARLGRAEPSGIRMAQLVADAQEELAGIGRLSRPMTSSPVSIPRPPRARDTKARGDARWATNFAEIDDATNGGLSPVSLWTVVGEGSGSLVLQMGIGIACRHAAPTRLVSARRTSEELETLFDALCATTRISVEAPISFQPLSDVRADALIEEVIRASEAGARVVVIESLERVRGFTPEHAEALARTAREHDIALMVSARASPRLEETLFELSCLGDANLSLTPASLDGSVFIEVGVATDPRPKTARLDTNDEGLFAFTRRGIFA